jgi:hypothetical protein
MNFWREIDRYWKIFSGIFASQKSLCVPSFLFIDSTLGRTRFARTIFLAPKGALVAAMQLLAPKVLGPLCRPPCFQYPPFEGPETTLRTLPKRSDGPLLSIILSIFDRHRPLHPLKLASASGVPKKFWLLLINVIFS